MSEHRGGRRLRIAWVEEWMSTLAREILPHLARRHDVTYVTAGEEQPAAEFVEVIRGRHRRHMNLAGFELSRRVNRLYADGRIDLAMVWASIGFGLAGVPFINLEGTSVYAEIGLFAARVPFYKRARFLPGLVHYALPEMACNRRAARVIVPSEALKRDIVRLHGLPAERVVVVPHGVEPEHLTCYDRKTPGRRPAILFVGRLHFRKGILPVLREFVLRTDIEADFHIAGDGPERRAMEQAAAGDDRVKLLGPVGRDDLRSLLATTQVFVLPTYYEGFGLSLLEAMASGHACVCYDIPVVREVLGDCGALVPLGDAAALVDVVAKLVRDRQAVATAAARAHERAAIFSWDEARTNIDRIVRDTYLDLETRTRSRRQPVRQTQSGQTTSGLPRG
jgi:glycosyltransferase involved in cell wall biosynthesis